MVFTRLAVALLALAALSAPVFAQDRSTKPAPNRTSGKLGIFGKDTRRDPPEKYNELTNSVGRLEMRFGRSRSVCTAFCVADNVAATAAHCLFTPKVRNGLASAAITIGERENRRISAIDGETEEKMQWSVISGTTFSNSAAPYNSAYDWALVRLAAPICKGRSVRLWERERDSVGAWPKLAESEMFILAYHGDLGAKSLKLSDDCVSSDAPLEPDLARWLHSATNLSSEDLLLHRCDISRGASGSPVFLDSGAGPLAIAVNVVAEGIRQGRGLRQEWDKQVSANRSVLVSAFENQVALVRDAPDIVLGDGLKSIQQMLKETGYYKGEITGRYETETRQAILNLERALGLPVTGRPSSRLVKVAASLNSSARDRRLALGELLMNDPRRSRKSAVDEDALYGLVVSAATKAIKLDPKSALAYGSRGAVYLAKGDYDRAIADYTKVIEIDPKQTLAYNNRGSAYRARKDYDRAIADFKKAAEIDPKSASIHVGWGLVYFEMRDFDRAIAQFGRAIALDPGHAVAYNNRAWTYLKAGKAALGLSDVKRSLELRPNDATALDTLAHILEATGLRDEAIVEFRKALAVDPNLKESAEGLKRLGAEP